MKKKIAIGGSTGFIGSEISRYFIENNFEIVPLRREEFSGTPKQLASRIGDCKIIINLAGAPIMSRWTGRGKEKIYQSRIGTTGKIVDAICNEGISPELFISGSAIGIYDDHQIHSESSNHLAEGFLAKIVMDWEEQAMRAASCVDRLVILRTGVVLGRSGGALPQMMLPFRFGMGGKIGSGEQWMSFIHIKDAVRAIEFIIDNKDITGIVNLTAPEIIKNRVFAKRLGANMKRPSWIKVPEFVLKALYGEGAGVLTGGQAAKPEQLLNSGFVFEYPEIDAALQQLMGREE